MLLFYFQCDAISIENFSYRTVHILGLPVLHFEIYILQAHRLQQSRIQLNIFNSKSMWSQTMHSRYAGRLIPHNET